MLVEDCLRHQRSVVLVGWSNVLLSAGLRRSFELLELIFLEPERKIDRHIAADLEMKATSFDSTLLNEKMNNEIGERFFFIDFCTHEVYSGIGHSPACPAVPVQLVAAFVIVKNDVLASIEDCLRHQHSVVLVG